MSMLLMFALSLLGFCGLALSLSRHHADALGAYPAPVVEKRWRAAGALLVTLSLAVPLLRRDYNIAIIEWIGLLTISALSLVAVLSWQPKWLKPVAAIAAGLSLLALAGWLFG